MAKRKASRFRAGLSEGLASTSDVFGSMMRAMLQEDVANRGAMRNDSLQRSRTAQENIASGKWSPDQGSAYERGQGVEPSVSQKLSGIMEDTQKAPSMQQVDTRSGLAQKFKANRLPVMGFGPTPQVDEQNVPYAPDNGTLPSTQFGDTNSPAFKGALEQRAAKLRSFPPEKTGTEMVGSGADAQQQDIYTRPNADTGQLDRVQNMPAGPTAGQKGSFEGTAQAATENLTRGGKVQTATDTAKALQPIQVSTAQQEARVRATEAINGDIRRAALSGGLLPEQEQAARSLAGSYYTESKDFFEVQNNFRKLTTIINRAGGSDLSGPSAVAALYAYAKLNDPGAAVQEGDKANVTDTTSVSGRLWNMYNAAIDGGVNFNPQQLQRFVQAGSDVYQSGLAEQQQRMQFYTGQANARKIPANLIVREPAPGLELIGQEKVINGVRLKVIGVTPDGDPITEPVAAPAVKGRR